MPAVSTSSLWQSINELGRTIFGSCFDAPLLGALLHAGDDLSSENLIRNGGVFRTEGTTGHVPKGFTTTGNVSFGKLGNKAEFNDCGFRLMSGTADSSGGFSTTVTNLKPQNGRWFRLRIRGMAQDHFAVSEEGLCLKADFFRDGGKNNLDHISKPIDGQVMQDRKDLADPGTNKLFGKAVWRSFELEFRTPFPEVDTLVLSTRPSTTARERPPILNSG